MVALKRTQRNRRATGAKRKQERRGGIETYLFPVFIGSILAYTLMTRQIRTGLSPEASVGLMAGEAGEIPRDRFGRPL